MMILVIGGRGSGKRAWTARHLGLTPPGEAAILQQSLFE